MSARIRVRAMDDSARLDAARRLISAAMRLEYGAGAEQAEYGDGDIVSDFGIGYASGHSPAAGNPSEVWVTGNWNDRRYYDGAERIVTSTIPSRLCDALERLSVNVEWADGAQRCANCARLIETQPSHYGWQPSFVIAADGDTLCKPCALDDDMDELLGQFVGNQRSAVSWLSAAELEPFGWADALPESADAESSWHSGQNDTPELLLTRWRARLERDGADESSWQWLFVITERSQFYSRFRLLARPANDDWSDGE